MLFLSIEQSDVAGWSCARADTVNPLAARQSALAITANIYFGDEYEEAVAVESDFYLLDVSLIEILKAAKFKPEFADGKARPLTDEDYLHAAAQAFTATDDAEAEVIRFLINDAMRRYRLSHIRTDRFGRGSSKPIRTGGYYLFGIGRTDAEVFLWHLPVRVEPGGEPVELDQTNAAVIFAAEE